MLFTCLLNVKAQGKNEFQIGTAIPGYDFGSDNSDRFYLEGEGSAGGASAGLYLSYKHLFSSKKIENLHYILSVSTSYNDLKSITKDNIIDRMGSEIYQYSIPKYFNVPLMLGLQYDKALSQTVSLFGETNIGVNMLYVSKKSFVLKAIMTDWAGNLIDGEAYYIKEIFKPSFHLTYKLGTGVIINDKYIIGLSYLALGSHKIRYVENYNIPHMSIEESLEKEFDRKLKVSNFIFTAGLRF